MSKIKPKKADTRAGSLELRVDGFDYAVLVAVGLLAAIPVTTWTVIVTLALGIDDPPRGGVATNPVVAVLGIGLVLFTMLVAPWLVPILVVRARQPRGARIEWDADGVTEWDGPWKRATIAWTDLRAGRVTWETPTKGRTYVDEALQLVGPPPAPAITVWTERPAGVPNFRRRLCADRPAVEALRTAVESHGIALDGHPDWLLACDPERPPHRALTIVGRFGYPLAVIGPFTVPISHAIGIALSAAAAALLATRALPSVREVRALSARASSPPSPSDITASGRASADRWRLRAATIEVVVRIACVVMVVVSTAVAFVKMH